MASEQEIELLEQYLDGELPQDQKAVLAQRLESDQDLSRELSGLKSAREMRCRSGLHLRVMSRSLTAFSRV